MNVVVDDFRSEREEHCLFIPLESYHRYTWSVASLNTPTQKLSYKARNKSMPHNSRENVSAEQSSNAAITLTNGNKIAPLHNDHKGMPIVVVLILCSFLRIGKPKG